MKTLHHIFHHVVCIALWHQSLSYLEEGASAYDAEPSLEKQLSKQLMQNYSKVGLNGRPIANMSNAIDVSFGLGLIQMDLNERDKILSTSMWSRYKWKDDYLRWSPADWGGIRALKFTPDQIWKPDIMLYNTAETASAQREVLAVVGADGTVIWIPHQIFSLQDLDLQLAFESGIDLSTFMADYKDSCSWDIINSTAVRNAMPPDNPTMVVLGFTLRMQRKLVFATYMLTLPCVFLASLTLVVFWLPPDRPDRTSLSMSVFASFLLLLLILVEAAPPTASSVPTLGIYYCFNMVLIMVSIFLSTLVVNIGRGGDNKTRVPKWLRITCKLLSRLVCQHNKIFFIDNRNVVEEEESKSLLSGSDKLNNGHVSASGFNAARDPNNWNKDAEGDHQGRFSALGACNFNQTNTTTAKSCDIQMEMQDVRTSMQSMITVIATNMIREQKLRAIKREWASVALVLDRMFFVLYIVAITVSLVLTFPKPPEDYSTLPM